MASNPFGVDTPATTAADSTGGVSGFFSGLAGSFRDSGWADFLNENLQNGISRVVDAEIDKNYRVNDTPPLYANERGQVGVAGQAGVVTAPTVTVLGRPTSPMVLAAGAAAALLVLFVLLRR